MRDNHRRLLSRHGHASQESEHQQRLLLIPFTHRLSFVSIDYGPCLPYAMPSTGVQRSLLLKRMRFIRERLN